MDLTVVIPVFNEAESIRELVEEVRSRLDGKFDYELVVVDDGSTDSTSAILMECR
ncbi:MAG: glycosyltransferase, partial [Gammaproteobacteria bacterium]